MLSGILFIITQLMTQNKNNQCKKIRAKKQHLNVPSEVDGLPTTSIRKNFYRGNSLTSVNIPDSVTTIEDGALWFYKFNFITVSEENLNFSSVDDGVLIKIKQH